MLYGIYLTSISAPLTKPITESGIPGNRLGQASLGPSGNERQVMGTEKHVDGVTTPFEKVKLQGENNPFLGGVFDLGIIFMGSKSS